MKTSPPFFKSASKNSSARQQAEHLALVRFLLCWLKQKKWPKACFRACMDGDVQDRGKHSGIIVLIVLKTSPLLLTGGVQHALIPFMFGRMSGKLQRIYGCGVTDAPAWPGAHPPICLQKKKEPLLYS